VNTLDISQWGSFAFRQKYLIKMTAGLKGNRRIMCKTLFILFLHQ